MKNTIFRIFTPKENKFFSLLLEQAEIATDAANKFYEFVKKKDENIDLKYDYDAIKEVERKGDRVTATILSELSSTFITPFDREDIHDLANNLDDVIDQINSCAKKILLYNPLKLPPEAKNTAYIIKQSAELIIVAIENLSSVHKNAKIITKICENLHELENQGDDYYAQFITNIFREGIDVDVVEIVKLKDIMTDLEKTTDCADYIGKILRTILVKYA